jgi:predicted secreted protein
MLCGMSTSFDDDDLDDKVIDITPAKPNKRRRKLIIIIVAAIVILVALFRSVSIYISALW